jgi:AraC-like DNA-binding protein
MSVGSVWLGFMVWVEGSCRGVGSLFLKRFEVDIAELDRAALALQADRAAGRFGAGVAKNSLPSSPPTMVRPGPASCWFVRCDDPDEHLVETIALGDPAAAEDAARTHVEAVWFRLAEQTKSTTEPEGDPLQRATAHLVFRLHCPLKLTHVASKIAFTSPGNLSRLFRQQHGLSFQAYLQRLRLEKAAELLRNTRLPIARIAKRVGYRDVSRFGQHFKRTFKATPVEYRVAEQR